MTFDEYGYPDDDTIIKIKTFDLGLKFEKKATVSEFLRLIWDNWEYSNT